jgi:Putative transposase, YhgA-like
MQENTEFDVEKDANNVHHGGDKGFKIVMKRKDSALEYLRVFFPKLFVLLDTDNFELDNTNYIKEDFNEFYSDVVYRTYLKELPPKHKKAVSVVLLFEHKKSIESYFLLFLQLLEYIVMIWREDIKNKRKPSVIVPIVVYQGKRGIKPKQLHDYFKGIPEELLPYIPNFKYFLTNVHSLATADVLALDETGLLRSLFLAYSYAEKKDMVKDMLIEVFKFFHHLPDGFKFFHFFLDFIASEDYLSPEERHELFNHYLSPQQKEGVMNTYQALRYEGLLAGLQEGRQEGRQEGLTIKARLVVLRGRFRGASAEFLADQSELTLIEVENMLKGYDEVYKFWANVKTDKKAPLEVAYLSEQEVHYLLKLFSEKLN